MQEINIRLIESNSERDRLGQYVPNYRNLRGRDIFVQVDEFDMPIKGTHRIPELPMPEYTAPTPEAEKVQYEWNFKMQHVCLDPPKPIEPPPPPIEEREFLPEEPTVVKLRKKKNDKRALSEEMAVHLINLYAGGFSHSEIGKTLRIKREQVAAFINSKGIQQEVAPVLSLQMIERIREMWLKGALPMTISQRLGYNYHLCTEFVLAYSEQLDREKPTRGIANSWVVRIKAIKKMGGTATEIAYKLKIPMFWVKRILE